VDQTRDTDELLGFVDLHTHPMAHLGFGGQLFYGAPDGSIENALGGCQQFHGDPALIGPGGNLFRKAVVGQLEGTNAPPDWSHGPDGAPGFGSWPRWHDRSHQHMWVEWIERAWQGGLRGIVALAVNSHLLAAAARCDGTYDDMSVGNNQIDETRRFIDRHSDFMELADSASKFRDIVGRGKLAVIIGLELDCIGDFYSARDLAHSHGIFNATPSDEEIRAEVDRLFGLGVRYVFPVHLTDNVFGGAAIYDRSFDTASRYSFGAHYQVEAAPSESLIGYEFRQSGLDTIMTDAAALVDLGFNPDADMPAPVPTISGHRNSRRLTPSGEVLINHLMDRGMIIDVDHMSERTLQGVLEIAEARRYPLLAGHASLRHSGGSEREHLPHTLRRIYALWGLWGLGSARGLDAFASLMHEVDAVVPQSAYALGTDVCGLEQQPRPRHPAIPEPDTAAAREANGMVVYRDTAGATDGALQRCRTDGRTWDFALDGCAHYGLLPDMLEEAAKANLVDVVSLNRLFRSAEALATAWQRCEYPYRGMDTIVVGTDGRVWHGIRQDSGWSGFGDVAQAAGGDLGAVSEIAATEAPNGQLTVFAVLSDGTLRTAMRHDAGWTPFADVPLPAGPVAVAAAPANAGAAVAVGAHRRLAHEDVAHAACAYEPAGRLHLLAVTSAGGLYHGFWKGAQWTGFGDVRAVAGGRLAAAEVHSATCAFEPGGRLHVVVVGSTGLLHGFRDDSGWTRFGEIADAFGTDFGGSAPIGAACAYEPGGRLHVVVVTADGRLWHGYRLDTGWAPFVPTGAAGVSRAGCSYEPGGRLNVLALTTDGRLLHGYLADANWTGFLEVPADIPAGHFANVAMAVPA
jgi:microsomal dipeptidase-like Zn-dependent dipeptidase